MPLLMEEVRINSTKGYRFSESGKYEPFTDDLGPLYRSLVKEHGRCTGRVYLDVKSRCQSCLDVPGKDGLGHECKTCHGSGDVSEVKAVGWVFVKRAKYEDTNDTYLQETWVTLYDAPDEVTRRQHYHYMN